MLRKRFIIVLMVLFGLSIMGGKVYASDKVTTTSTINGISVNLEYRINNEGNIEDLVCKNATELSGNVTIPQTIKGKNVTSIGSNAFKSATGITEITIPNSVTEIEMYAFENCTGLTKINFGTGVTKIGISAFKGCTGLKSVTLPKSLNHSLTGGSGDGPFGGCTNLTSVTFEEGTTVIGEGICAGITGITEITIPNSVTKIEMDAFENCPNLKKITILDNVKNIELFGQDTIFRNRNEDLTIYCYEGSTIDEYAKKHNIKTVYLTRPTVLELTAVVTYNPTISTTYKVTATIKTNKEVNKVGGWTLSNDGKTLTKTYSKNTTETVQLKDIDGKTKDVEIKITNITTATENKSDTQDSVKGKEDLTLTPETNLPKTGSNTIIIAVIGATILLFAVAVYNKFKKYEGI